MRLYTFLGTVLTTVAMVSHKGRTNSQECHHTSMCDSARGCGGLANEERVIFVRMLLEPILPVHFHRCHRKYYLRSLDKRHQRALSGPLTVNTNKGRSPLCFQSDQILQFPVCVLKILMVTSSAFIHIDRRHSHDKDSLSGSWPLRQAPVRVTSRLRDIPRARAQASLPHMLL